MTNKVGIGIDAQFDASGVEQQINALGQKIAAANKVQFTPVSVKSIEDVKKLNAALGELYKTQTGLRKRLKDTNQESTSFTDWDWERMYPHAASRAVAQHAAFSRVVGGNPFSAVHQPSPPPPGGGGGSAPPPAPRPGDGSLPGTGASVAQAGLRAAGPAGGVAANALGTGMSAGFGAGLGSLLGGMLALGVSKVVGGIMEKVGQAEDNAVAMDRLKRTLGDVNVSFEALKTVVHGGADNLKITYAEAGQLAQQFVKLGNVSSENYKSLSDELDTGVGLSRSFGLDPSQGVGVMGQMRGLGVTSNSQESRRFALLIGETIGRSGAFAKADEVMDAIAGYATSQTRNSMGAANVAGYAGMYSGMVGSGIPGMDPAGAAGLLSRINSSLSAGGAKGEASQFFTAMVGHRMGLDPLKTQVLREGGAFATNDAMFGEDSAYRRYMGGSGPTGSKTFLQGTLEAIKQQYSGDDDDSKLMRAQATANHLGVNMNQAMALLSVRPNRIGEMQDYGDLSKLSGNGIGNLSKALYGSGEDRQALARSLGGRADVADADKDAIKEAMKGPESVQREVLARMTAQYDQERTTGSDIRDSKNALDNIKTSLADRLVPISQAMRDGILFLAGGGKKSRLDVMKDIEAVESGSRVQAIDREYEGRLRSASQERGAARAAINELFEKNRPKVLSGEMTQEEHARQMKPLQDRLERALKKDTEAREWHTEAIKKEAKLREDNIKRLEEADSAERAKSAPSVRDMGTAPGNQSQSRSRSSRGAGGRSYRSDGDGVASDLDSIKDPVERANVKAMLDAIADVEGANYNTLVGQGRNNREITDLGRHPNRVGMVTPDGPSTAAGRYQITGSTWKGVAGDLGLKDFSPESQDKAAIELMRRRGALEDVKRGDFTAAAKKLGSEWQGLPTGSSPNQGSASWGRFNGAINRSLEATGSTKAKPVERGHDLPDISQSAPPTATGKLPEVPDQTQGNRLPPGAAQSGQNVSMNGHMSSDPIIVQVVDANQRPIAPQQEVSTRVKTHWVPFFG